VSPPWKTRWAISGSAHARREPAPDPLFGPKAFVSGDLHIEWHFGTRADRRRARVGIAPYDARSTHPPRPHLFGGEDALGRDRVVVLGHDLWIRRFGGDPAIIGQPIRLDGGPYVVVGVLASGFELPSVTHLYPMTVTADRPQIWTPLGLRPSEQTSGQLFKFVCIARLRPQVSAPQAISELNALQREIGRRLPGNIDLKASVVSLQEHLTGPSRGGLELLLASAAVVLLVVCVNIASLCLARGIARQHELAILHALGARGGRLLGPLLAEGLTIAAAGGLVAAGIAPTLLRLIAISSSAQSCSGPCPSSRDTCRRSVHRT
jgi:hypothetical protein